ncbi:MAG: hypothetical protein LH477_13425, partial [Nocardioides sp.]|nr:hypothetical protein [Nocardioides sp.]
MTDHVRPARPHHKLTDDGRRMSEVLTYSRRGSRFTPHQAAGGAAPPRGLGRPGGAGEGGGVWEGGGGGGGAPG